MTDVSWPSIPAMLAARVEQSGGEPAVIEGGRILTYQDLYLAARAFAAALVDQGVEAGDRVAIWAPNRSEWIVSLLGLSWAGAAVVPVNTRFKGPEAAVVLGRSRARALVVVSDFLGTDYVDMLRSAGDLPALEHVVVLNGERDRGAPDGRDAVEGWDAALARPGAAARAEADRRAGRVGTGDVSDILFTSGTTGVPKGVVQTHGRTLSVATDWVAMAGLRAGDRYLMINPYFHMFGLKAGILASVAAGAVMIPEPVFDLDRVLETVQRERVTVLPGAPTVYQSILDHPRVGDYDLTSLRVAVTGAADIPVELIRRVRDELPFSTIVAGYGLTEAGTATGTGPDDDFEAIATTVGRPRPGFEIRLVDSAGVEAGPDEAGEVLLRGPSVMSHYLDDPESTASALSSDGWLRTGDLGSFDRAGRLRIVGRVKDMFIVGGFNAYPAEIENILLGHPDIRQAAVIGVPDTRMGEVGMAFVVVRAGSSLSGPDVVEWSRRHMANYKVPRVVEIVDELPLNATGKVQKDVLKARAAPRQDSDV
jgi:HIP---CoA ligase